VKQFVKVLLEALFLATAAPVLLAFELAALWLTDLVSIFVAKLPPADSPVDRAAVTVVIPTWNDGVTWKPIWLGRGGAQRHPGAKLSLSTMDRATDGAFLEERPSSGLGHKTNLASGAVPTPASRRR
jgi:hypothetical protein